MRSILVGILFAMYNMLYYVNMNIIQCKEIKVQLLNIVPGAKSQQIE